MRIRTDNRPERQDVIDAAADEWGCNKTDAVVASCELATWIMSDLEELLADPRIPPAVAQEIAEGLEGLHLEVETTDPTVSIAPKE